MTTINGNSNVYIPEQNTKVNTPNPVTNTETVTNNTGSNNVTATVNPNTQGTSIPNSGEVHQDVSTIGGGSVNQSRVASGMDIVSSMEGGNVPDRLLNNGVTEIGRMYVENEQALGNLSQTVNLNSRTDRMAFTESTTQLLNTTSANYTNGCAASCIVNGAMIEGGQQGLNNLLDVIESRGDDSATRGVTGNSWNSIPEWSQLDGIRERVASNQVTRQDLLTLQSVVYQQMSHMEAAANPNNRDSSPNVRIGTVRDYLNTDTSTFGIMPERPLIDTLRNTDIRLIDTDADRATSEHFVLGFRHDGSSGTSASNDRVFDPWPRASGGQITDDSGEVEAYRSATLHVAFPRN